MSTEDSTVELTEIIDQLNSLGESDLNRLKCFADRKMFGMEGVLNGKNSEDLLQEAFSRVISGSRKWYPSKVNFIGFLFGVIRSIASEWRKKLVEIETVGGDNIRNINGEFNKYEKDIERRFDVDRKIKAIKELFKEDKDALISQIIDGRLEGLTRSEIMECLEISIKEYETAMKKLYRRCQAKFSIGGCNAKEI